MNFFQPKIDWYHEPEWDIWGVQPWPVETMSSALGLFYKWVEGDLKMFEAVIYTDLFKIVKKMAIPNASSI